MNDLNKLFCIIIKIFINFILQFSYEKIKTPFLVHRLICNNAGLDCLCMS